MWRSATLAIEVSSTCMKVAIETTTAISQGLRSPAPDRVSASPDVPWPSISPHLDVGEDGHAGPEIQIGRPVEHDLDRHPLHHLDVVAGRILRRQQAEGGAA